MRVVLVKEVSPMPSMKCCWWSCACGVGEGCVSYEEGMICKTVLYFCTVDP